MMDTTKRKVALLVVDLQNDLCHPAGTADKRGKDIHACHGTMKQMEDRLETARDVFMRDFFVTIPSDCVVLE